MKAAVLVRPRTIEIQERPVPEPGPGQVRVKVAAVGVCGSDVHYYEEGRIGNAVCQYPTLMGHEPSGVVDAVGPESALETGMRVAIEPSQECGHCPRCREGRPNLCEHLEFLGTPPEDGIFSQYRLMPEHCCYPIPDTMSLVEAAMLEPLAIGFHAARLARVDLGERAAIFGSGPIGLVTLMALQLAGAGPVFMTDLVPERLEFAKKLGAADVMNPRDGDVVDWIKRKTGGRGVEIAVECAGQQQTLTHAMLAPRRGGRTLIIGIPSVDELALPMHDIRRKELAIYNVRRSCGELQACIDLVAAGRIDVRCLATHFFPLEKITDAFDLVHRYADGVIRAVIRPNGEID